MNYDNDKEAKYEIGGEIKKTREQKGYTQKELAERLGISSARLSNWELGINRPDVEMFARICYELDASADEMLKLTDESCVLSQEALQVAYAYDGAIPEIRAAVRAMFSL